MKITGYAVKRPVTGFPHTFKLAATPELAITDYIRDNCGPFSTPKVDAIRNDVRFWYIEIEEFVSGIDFPMT